ncbi:PLP-dependent aminotransferase family protein [Paenibacillus sp. GSMTC-2017]|uniref:aminotransferase-like domain-containing protein n=1 Tax=Paenibacillus sp. GSMTC-2017 TaxID=2794350 RepID=UPI0018D6D3D7|nr:PLP-dependent aminotransferase family protein [Paenibacillus sp. GSMTC-2017]MBH5320073.1 PLP-dependent aminotransferase family protein [Paenibacillus sp. GSMTC-2017]
MKKTIVSRQNHPLFRQVYDHILNRIDRGEWSAHTKLPSIRLLADEINVHRLTVFKAYRGLTDDGKVYVKDKSGYFVSEDSVYSKKTQKDKVVSTYAVSNSLADIHRIPAKYQFSQALIDPNLLPNIYLSEYVKKVFDLYPKVMGTYASIQGDEELRGSLSEHFRENHHLQLSSDELLITSGAQQAISMIAQVMLGPMDTVMVERPTYSSALDIFRRQGARLIPVSITPEGYNLDEVETLMHTHKPRMFYMNPTHHNPTGYTVPAWQRKLLVELAERYNCLLVEDDPFRDIYFDKPPPLPLFAYDTEGWVIYINSFSKYIAPGLRICAVACRYPFMEQLIKAKSLADNGTPLLNQKIFLHYYTSQRLQQHLEKLRIALQVHKEIMEEELSLAGWEWRAPEGGLNLWVKLPRNISSEALFRMSIGQSISFVPGEIFDPLGELRSWIRLSYSFANEILLREGMQRLTALSRTF